MANRTPLPSWLKFDSGSLTFWGMTPVLITGSQTYGIDFIASDVAGFAGATTTFSLLISSNQLAFNPQAENDTVVPGTTIMLGPFLDQLRINGVQATSSQLQKVVAEAPDWLTFQNDSLKLTGIPPQDFGTKSISITVTDTFGDIAVKNILLRTANASLFDDEIGNLTATAGSAFSYTLSPSLLSQNNINLSVDVGSASSWLQYDASKRQLQGFPPTTAKASANMITLTASSGSNSEIQTLYINLKAAATAATSHTRSSTRTSPTATTISPSTTALPAKSKDESMTTGIIVGIVIGCLAVLALFFAVAMLCCRRRRKEPRKKIEKSAIRPVLPYGDQAPMVAEGDNDEEKYIGSPVKRSPDEPPHLEVDLPMAMQPPMKPRHFLGGRDARQSKFNLGSIKGSPCVRRQTTSSSLLEPPARNPRRLVSGPHVFPPGLPRAITPSPDRGTSNNSPTLPPGNTTDNWTTTDTSSSLSRDDSDARAAARYAKYALEMELPRHQRTWVRPGEASPTPPPSSVLRTTSNSREAARRRWAERLNHNSSGNLASRSPSPVRVTLTGVSASGIKGRKQRLKISASSDDDKENKSEDRLSKLVSNDSFSGARHMRGRKSLLQVEAANRISSSMAEVEDPGAARNRAGDDDAWEDVGVDDTTQDRSMPKGVLTASASDASSVRFL
ncbi:hypothetical protein KCU61_g3164, partial [Aureobasidium melanogenum]